MMFTASLMVEKFIAHEHSENQEVFIGHKNNLQELIIFDCPYFMG